MGKSSRSQKKPQPNRAQPLDRPGLEALLAGTFLAVLVSLLRQVTFFLSYFITLVHELGHAFAAWLFGYAAVPAFDFLYGGGVTMQLESRFLLMVLAIWGSIGWLFWRCRRNAETMRWLLAALVGYCLAYFTPLHEMLAVAMGHGFELLFAALFLYRGLSGEGCRYSIERPLYVMLAVFTVLQGMHFSWQLLFDADFRSLYLAGKGGVIDNDFVRLARDYWGGIPLSVVAGSFLLTCPIALVAGWGLFRYQPHWQRGWLRLRQAEGN